MTSVRRDFSLATASEVFLAAKVNQSGGHQMATSDGLCRQQDAGCGASQQFAATRVRSGLNQNSSSEHIRRRGVRINLARQGASNEGHGARKRKRRSAIYSLRRKLALIMTAL